MLTTTNSAKISTPFHMGLSDIRDTGPGSPDCAGTGAPAGKARRRGAVR